MSNVLRKVDVESGRYTFIMYEHDYRIHVRRNGAPWMIIERGHNAIFSLLMEFIETRKELEDLQEKFKFLLDQTDNSSVLDVSDCQTMDSL